MNALASIRTFCLAAYFSVQLADNKLAKVLGKLVQINRSQVFWTPVPSLFVEAGRIHFEDPLGLTVSGLFDGAQVSLNRDRNTLNAALLFSGLQYKERAKIVMTTADLEDYMKDAEYFAARRLIFSLSWQSRYLGNQDNILDLGLLAQVDLRTGPQEKLHSQYLVGKFTFPLSPLLDMGTGLILGVKEQDSGSALSYAGHISLNFAVPGALADKLSFTGFVSSGSVGRVLRPYFPVTSLADGEVFTPSLAGISTLKLSYQIKLTSLLYCSLTGRYFLRTTRDIIPGITSFNNSAVYSLGVEFYASAVWSILSDLSLNAGAGVFIPTGAVKEAGTPVMWKLSAAVTLSI
jgi:hypothetical protein